MAVELREGKKSLWSLVGPPLLWAAHFFASYLTVAVWCAKAGPDGSLDVARVAIAAYTLLALAGIGTIGWRGYKGYSSRRADAALDSRRFLDHAALLLSGLSLIAVVYSALAAVFIESCR